MTAASVSVLDARAIVSGDDLSASDLADVARDCGFDAEPIATRPAPAVMRSEIELYRAAVAERQQRTRRHRRARPVGADGSAPLDRGRSRNGRAPWPPWVLLAGATSCSRRPGAGFYRSAFAARHGTTNMDTLIAIAATTAYGFSLVVFLARPFGRLVDYQPLYFTEAQALLGIISLGHWLDAIGGEGRLGQRRPARAAAGRGGAARGRRRAAAGAGCRRAPRRPSAHPSRARACRWTGWSSRASPRSTRAS